MVRKPKSTAIVRTVSGNVSARKKENMEYEELEFHDSDEELASAMFPKFDDYMPLTFERVRAVEIQRQIFAAPPWITALQKSIYDLTVKVTALQSNDALSNSQPLKLYNAMIYDLNSSEFDLVCPIHTVIEEYTDETIARMPELNIFVSSDTDTEAILNLKKEVIALFMDLNGRDNLGSLPQSWLNTLNRLLVRRT
jgi:hypothetical protein